MLWLFAMTGVLGGSTILEGVRQLLSGEESVPKALLVIAVGLLFAAVGFGFLFSAM